MSWLRRTHVPWVTERVEPELPAAAGELFMRLDESGQVLLCSVALLGRLSVDVIHTPARLIEYLARPVPWLDERPENWPSQLPVLVLKGAEGRDLHVNGWLKRDLDGWLMQLLDVTEVMSRLEQTERRQQLFEQLWRSFSALEAVPLQAFPDPLESCLEEVALRLRIPWLAVVVPEEGGCRIVHSVQLPDQQVFAWNESELRRILISSSGREAWQHHAQTGGSKTWLVPYRESGVVQAWLVCGGFDARRQVPYLSAIDWLPLFAQLAGPLLSRLRAQAQSESDNRSSVVQRVLGAGWWEYLPERQSLRIAPALAAELGLQGDEEDRIDLTRWLQILEPADRDEFRVHLDEAVSSGRAFTQSLRLATQHRPACWYQLQAEVSGRGSHRQVTGVALDINGIKQKEAEAAAANARLEGLVDSSPAIIYVQRYDEGAFRIEFCSASLGTLLGWTTADLQEQSFAAFLHPDDREAFFARARSLLQRGTASCRYRMRDRAGVYHWFLDEARLLRDELGMPQEMVGLCLDVTEATESAERVRESEERYRVLVEDSPAMICRYLPDLTLTFANRPLTDCLGVPGGQPINEISLGNYLSPGQQQEVLARLQKLTPEQPVSSAEICLHLSDTESAWWVWSDRGLFDADGRLVEIQAVARDNTEVHRARQQLYQSAKMATLGEMATGLAHEINQPLNVMRMALTNTLKRLENDSLTTEYLLEKLQRIESQVARAARIVDHVRIFGRRSEVEGARFDLARVVEGALSLTAEGMEKQGVALHVQMPELPEVVGHSDRLEQVLINLLLNAQYAVLNRRGSQAGIPEVRVEGYREANRVGLRVSDNGGGIDPELLERIFEPFFTTKPVGKGTGLGLSVSYGIVKQMRGELKAENGPLGAVFSISLPVPGAEADQSSSESP